MALSCDGNALAVGAPAESSLFAGSGAAYLFQRQAQTWVQTAYFKASNPGPNNLFGTSVALSCWSDQFGGLRLAVGLPQESSQSTGVDGNQTQLGVLSVGAVFIFSRTSSSPASWVQEAYIKPSDAALTLSFFFGFSISLSADGRSLLCGAYGETGKLSGINPPAVLDDASFILTSAAYLFQRYPSTGWNQVAYMKASNPSSNNYFGFSVSLSLDATSALVGARGEGSTATLINGLQTQGGATFSGAAYFFSTGLSVVPPPPVPSVIDAGTSINIAGSLVIPPDSSIFVAGSLNVTGLLIVSGQLTVASGGVVSVSGGLVVQGNVTVFGNGAAVISVQGPFSISSGSVLTVVVSGPESVTVATYQSAPTGTFSNVTALGSSGSPSCAAPVNPPSTSYGSTLLTVVVVFQNVCSSSNGFSNGAIIGIVVGTVVGGFLVAAVIVVLTFWFRKRRDINANIMLHRKQIDLGPKEI